MDGKNGNLHQKFLTLKRRSPIGGFAKGMPRNTLKIRPSRI
jgi:hypothetical protein